MKLSQFRHPIPKNLIAKPPKSPPDMAKMMVLNREDESILTSKFKT